MCGSSEIEPALAGVSRREERTSAADNANRRTPYPAYKVAAAHVAPVFLNTSPSVDKACSVIEEAAGHGARLIAFPEAFLPGFPVWAALEAPIRTHELFKRLAASAVLIDGPELARIRQTDAPAARARDPRAECSP